MNKFYLVSTHPEPDNFDMLPFRATSGSAGYDLKSIVSVAIYPNTTVTLRTGVKVELSKQCYLNVRLRSSLARKGLVMVDSGVIDQDYFNNPSNEGEILVTVRNIGDSLIEIHYGDRIAQGIFTDYRLTSKDTCKHIFRTGGHGSTGR